MQLNERQLDAVEYGNFPLLILAGAGTGKTTTILNRIKHVVAYNSIKPESILALTFSVEAAETLKSRLLNKNFPGCDLITVSTFHSFAKNIIEDNYLQLGYLSIPTIIDKDDLVYLFLKNIDSFNYFKSKRYNRFPIKAIRSLLSIHDQFCQELFDDKDLDMAKEICLNNISKSSDEDDEVYRQILDSIVSFKDFKKIKKESMLIEYEDMIYDVWKLINTKPKVLLALQKKYSFIIIDEFQDNNYAFSEIINKMASHQNITVVGDDDQSIYSFRGANSYNMHDFDNYYSSNPNYKKIELIKNYRSNQNILDVANSVIVNNDNRMDKEFLVSGLNNDFKNSEVKLCVGDYNSQLAEIVSNVKGIINKNKKRTIAVLCRTHSDCSSIARILNKNKILHNYNNARLFDQKIIKDIIAFLNVAANSKYSLHALIRLSKKCFSEEIIKKIIDLDSKEKNILQACVDNSNLFDRAEYNWLNEFYLLSKRYKSKVMFIDRVVDFIKENNLSDYDIFLVDTFKEILRKFDGIYKINNIVGFCSYINLLMENNNTIVNQDTVQDKLVVNLMTVHNSKGMEFDFVFLPFLQSSKFPQANRKPDFTTDIPVELKKWSVETLDDKIYHIEEERRLFYVAITRAKEKLFLLTTDKRRSKFLKEINEELYYSEIIDSNTFINEDNPGYSEFYQNNSSTNPLFLSSSKINTYNQCQLRYKYSSLDLIPGFRYNSVFALGNIVHKVLEEFHKNHFNSFGNILNLLDKYWNHNLYSYVCESEQYYRDAKAMLENYISYLDGNIPSPVLFEYYFKIKMKDYVLSGAIDRLDVDDRGKITIYDYKTSKTQKSISQLKKDFQLPIYALAVYHEGNSMHEKIENRSSPISAGELSLRFSDLEKTVEFSKIEIEDIENSINQLAKEISLGVFKANPGFMNCAYCDYKKFICSYYD